MRNPLQLNKEQNQRSPVAEPGFFHLEANTNLLTTKGLPTKPIATYKFKINNIAGVNQLDTREGYSYLSRCSSVTGRFGCGFITSLFSGAVGCTPKSHTAEFTSRSDSTSISAYSPKSSGCLGVIFIQWPPGSSPDVVSTTSRC